MAVEVTVDLGPLESCIQSDALKHALGVLTEQVAQDSNIYCPVDTGMMRDTIKIDPDKGVFSWVVPYAVYAYNADSVKTVLNPNATPMPFETAKQRHMNEWVTLAVSELFGEVLA